MHYLTDVTEIYRQISQLTRFRTLWLDTEIANWNTPYPRLSLIQVLAYPSDLTGEFAYIFDVLDKPDLTAYFIQHIMVNSNIQKVFHNADFDLKYLGKNQAQNVVCTFKLAKKINRKVLQTTNLKLKTLAVELCQFSDVDPEMGTSDWGERPLSSRQLKYAAMDVVYLAAVHHRLLEISDPNAVSTIFSISFDSSFNGNFDNSNDSNLNNWDNRVNLERENSPFSPTKLRLAFECPRLFYLNYKFNCKSIFIPADSTPGIGNIFHQLADNLIDVLLTDPSFTNLFIPPSDQLDVEKLAAQIQRLFYQISFFPYLQTTISQEKSKGVLLYKVWARLQELIKKITKLLVDNRRYCTAKALMANTFINEDRNLEYDFNLPDGTKELIRGKYDCLVFSFASQRLSVIEFKTYQPMDISGQLAQTAIYSYMLSQRKKMPVDSAVYCFLPEFQEYTYTWEQLENTTHQIIHHKLLQMRQWSGWESPQPNPPPMTTQTHLCQICPEQQRCQTFFAAEVTTPQSTQAIQSIQLPKINQIPEPKIVDANAIEVKLVNTLASFGIGVEYQGTMVGPAFIRVKLKPHLGVKVNSLLKLSKDLQVQLELENPPLIASQAGYVSVDLPRKDRQIARFEDYIQRNFLPPTAKLKIALGVNIDGHLLEADLSDSNTCHFLVGGTTGSGKSEFLRSLLLSLLYRHSPQHLKIVLVDPKRVTFPEFERIPWLYSPVVKDSDRAVEIMGELVAEMDSRYQKFELVKCPNITTYNQNSGKILPRLVCIFDEYADFMAEKEIRSVLEQSIKRLGAMARAAGIHLIISTQRPEAGVVTPIIRSNLPGRIALRTSSAADSQIILGAKISQAADLLGKGDLVYPVGSQLQRIQSLFAEKIHLDMFTSI
ncbi:cell division protein FtsK [Cylindrospermopsis raciborskii CENA303]|uniref:Cell division protein FtsK n=1 Tax=Cylindrospermopsis raciborskii CENA303 TaxID=1170769 RepID=A0A1X4G8F2_9CYAN|nr:DNA translocase FtsK [Cylindrospermopsis raciborskii]OSO92239.1 cell division protein FtsK [Cylindrospermopsis raciborskii CENA303]